MNDDTRKLLKIFGVAVTDAEVEAERLVARSGQLSTKIRLLKHCSPPAQGLPS